MVKLVLVDWRKEKWWDWLQIGRDGSAYFSDLSFRLLLIHLHTENCMDSQLSVSVSVSEFSLVGVFFSS
jgi:hypothetical protein